MIKKIKTLPTIIGFSLSSITLISFCTITINGNDIKAPNLIQILTIMTLQIGATAFLPRSECIEKKQLISLSLIYLFLSLISSILSDSTETSLYRLAITYVSPIILIYILIRKEVPIEFSNGIMNGIIIITTISVLYSLSGAIISERYISRLATNTIDFNIFGVELSQKVAHRSFFFEEAKYLLQRIPGIFPNPNGFAIVCAITFGLSYNFKYSNRIKYTIRIISITGLILSFSRMGAVLFLANFTYMSLPSVKIRKLFVLTSSIFIISFLIYSAGTSNTLLSNMPLVQKLELLQLRERADSWALAWNAALQNWGFGVGFGVGSEYLFGDAANTQAVHSVFLNSFLEIGALGTFALIAIWIAPALSDDYTSNNCSPKENHRHVISGVLFGLFVAEAFDLSVTRFHYIHLIFFTLLGIWVSLNPSKDNTAGQNARSSQSPTLL
ncbi:hypothetical protein M9H61_16120 [Thalassospira sp. GO-4]|jgi:hypothetical protein|uniref:O-antigen ligase family protein n=1 Tax=Thalassospira sp. GO-4 TaxID=2946605 RepID=UPI0020253B3C|nr:O-antigen ligase family protein [Thalassospira sp. GO-4]URK17060.1 hypothetical protein M9H61_16120 [Thalassospira sp. GO-4]